MIDFLATHAGLIGLLFFFTFFMCVAVWIFRPGMARNYQNFALIPLRERDDD
jgi:cbb3-type cytochrome oxidase subunit 3